MGGRIDDITCVDNNSYICYVGFATGGVWKTTNNGTTFTPVFDAYSTASIGDIAIAPSNPDIVWVGTGEANNRQSSSFGDGIYKSTDAGKTFTKMGLADSQSIARIVIDPKDPNVVYVAVLGHLFGPNKERGVYKTTDGGKTWTNAKFIDEDTRLYRSRDGRGRQQDSVGCFIPAPPYFLGFQWWRTGIGPLEDSRRG